MGWWGWWGGACALKAMPPPRSALRCVCVYACVCLCVFMCACVCVLKREGGGFACRLLGWGQMRCCRLLSLRDPGPGPGGHAPLLLALASKRVSEQVSRRVKSPHSHPFWLPPACHPCAPPPAGPDPGAQGAQQGRRHHWRLRAGVRAGQWAVHRPRQPNGGATHSTASKL